MVCMYNNVQMNRIKRKKKDGRVGHLDFAVLYIVEKSNNNGETNYIHRPQPSTPSTVIYVFRGVGDPYHVVPGRDDELLLVVSL